MTMQLRRDERGRPVGLDWPEAPPEPVAQSIPKRAKPRKVYVHHAGGREPQEWCGAGRHRMSVTGVKVKTGGGRYCAECKNERNRAYRARQRATNQSRSQS